jgi:p-aminobenzoyl-glutamate transporter AbgT
MNLIHNERIKLLATALNNTAVATLVTVVIAPIAALLYGSVAIASAWWPLLGFAWIFAGSSLHLTAQLTLGRLKE